MDMEKGGGWHNLFRTDCTLRVARTPIIVDHQTKLHTLLEQEKIRPKVPLKAFPIPSVVRTMTE